MAEYIEREGVKKSINFLFDIGLNVAPEIKQSVLDWIDGERAADVQPVKHGYWEEEEPRVLKCSVCGEYAPMNYLGQNCIDSRYCPWCGARMDGDANG